jgi:hypothetical protein
VGLFVLSRIVLLARGFHFDVGLSGNAVQNLDPALLRSHLLQSLWYMHGQPPLWNAFLGAFMHLFPEHWPQAWHVVFLGLGLVVAVSLYFLLRELGIPGGAAVVVSAIFSLSPAVLLSENLLFYDYPSLAVLTATALGVALFVRRPTFVRGLSVFGGAGALVLSRTLFQVWWLLALAGLLLIACRGYRGVVLWSCALPLALVAGVYAKNWVMYGVPSTTSWTGMGVARAAVQALPLAERRRLVARGKLHPVSLVKPLAGLDNYEAVGIVRARPTGIPVLDEVSGHEYPRNLENKTYIRISRLYWKDDLWVVRHRPRAYARAVRTALADFFTSPTIGAGGQGDDAKIRRYDTWFDNVVYGRFGRGRVGKLLVAAYIVALGFGLWVGVRRLRPRADVVTVTVTFAALTILYVTVVGNLAEVGENYRFRFILDPLAISVVAVAVRGLWRRSRGLSRGAGVAR